MEIMAKTIALVEEAKQWQKNVEISQIGGLLSMRYRSQ